MEPRAGTAVQGRDQEPARSKVKEARWFRVPLFSRMWLQTVICQCSWQRDDITRASFPEVWLEPHLHWALITEAQD